MKKKVANVFEIVMIVISYVMLWLPLFSVQYTKMNRPMPLSISLMGLQKTAVVYIVTTICAINIVMCLFSIFTKKEYRDGKLHIFMPIVMFLYMAMMNTFDVGEIVGEWTIVENKFPSILFLVLMAIIIAISFIKRSDLIVGLPKVEVHNTSTNADELQKYKNLLDNGTITQEEFEAKKKQLLGL